MRTLPDGDISLIERDIVAFNRVWPASELHGLKGVTFQYDRNGALAGILFKNGDLEQWDGPALTALSQDAQDWSYAASGSQERREMREQYREVGHFPWWWPDSWAR